MSKMKKIVGVMLAAVMVLAMSVSALADDTYTITISYENSGHTYEAYQIFAGDLQYAYTEYTGTDDPGETVYTYDEKTGVYTQATYDPTSGNTYYLYDDTVSTVLSNIKWGSAISDGSTDNSEALLNALKADDTAVTNADGDDTTFGALFASCSTASDVAGVLTTYNTDNGVIAKKFADIVSEYLISSSAATSTASGQDSSGNYLYTISGLSAGYYLVKDKDGSVTYSYDSYTSLILSVSTNVKIAAKADTTTFDKTVGNTTDVSESGTNREDDTTADYDIGDNVPFTLKATLPSNYADYTTYKMNFHDTLSSGLSFIGNSVVVTVYADSTALANGNGTVVGSGYTVTAKAGYYKVEITSFEPGTTYYTLDNGAYIAVTDTSVTPDADTTYYIQYVGGYHYTAVDITAFVSGVTYYTLENGAYIEVTDTSVTPDADTTYYTRETSTCSIDVQILDTNSLKDADGNSIAVTSSSLIVVTYKAELNDAASTREYNNAYVEFSNNPNDDGAGTSNTPDDITTVFTFTLTVDKVDSNQNPLEGAGFTLYKMDDDGKYVAVEELSGYQNLGKITEFEDGVTYYTTTDNGVTYTKVDTSTTPKPTPDADTDYYVLSEFTFDGLAIGQYKIVETTTPSGYNTMDDIYFKISATTAEEAEGNASVVTLTVTVTDKNGNALSSGGQTFTTDLSSLSIGTQIVNKAGSSLPSTGGIGTTIFYVVGGILVAGAAILLITRKRMSSAK